VIGEGGIYIFWYSSFLFAREDLGEKNIHICGFEEFSCLGVFTLLQCVLLEKTYIASSGFWTEREMI